jgi:hypothetical protein
MNSDHAFSHSRMIAPYREPQVSASWSRASRAAAAFAAVQMGLIPRLSASQSRLEARWKVLRIRCVLCRRRHKTHYADLGIMPTWWREPLVAAA